jgi:DNA primase
VAQVLDTKTRTEQALEAAAAFYAEYLWKSEAGESIRGRLAREGLEEETVRAFEVGYIPGEHALVEDHLSGQGFSAAELYEAGIASRSRRGRLHSQFRSRIMFPIRDLDGAMLGFAAMATNPGPSWPLWLISPDRGRFDKRTAVFDAGHIVPRNEMIKETLDWLDRYLGPLSKVQ